MSKKKLCCLLLATMSIISLLLSTISVSAMSQKAQKAYDKKITTLKKQSNYKKYGLYTAKVKVKGGEDILLVSAGVFDSKYAISADIYQYQNGKVKFLTKVQSTGTSYPVCKKGNTILTGYHHSSQKYTFEKGKVILEEISGFGTYDDTKAIYKKCEIKNGKVKKIKETTMSKKKAEKMEYYCNSKGDYRGTPIKFEKQ